MKTSPWIRLSQTYEVEQKRLLSRRAERKRKAAECQRNYFATRANGAPRRINNADCELRNKGGLNQQRSEAVSRLHGVNDVDGSPQARICASTTRGHFARAEPHGEDDETGDEAREREHERQGDERRAQQDEGQH